MILYVFKKFITYPTMTYVADTFLLNAILFLDLVHPTLGKRWRRVLTFVSMLSQSEFSGFLNEAGNGSAIFLT